MTCDHHLTRDLALHDGKRTIHAFSGVFVCRFADLDRPFDFPRDIPNLRVWVIEPSGFVTHGLGDLPSG